MRNLQKGSAIIMAIFILVALAGLGAFMAVFSTSEQRGAALDLLGTQAEFASRAGVEWGASKVINDPAPPCSTGAGTTTSFAISGFTVSVKCVTSSASEAGMTALYALTVTACKPAAAGVCPGDVANSNYVERSLFTLIEK